MDNQTNYYYQCFKKGLHLAQAGCILATVVFLYLGNSQLGGILTCISYYWAKNQDWRLPTMKTLQKTLEEWDEMAKRADEVKMNSSLYS